MNGTEAPTDIAPSGRLKLVMNVKILIQRLGRSRDPWSGGDFNRRVRLAGLGAVLVAAAVVLAVVTLDAPAVGWARGLPDAAREFFRSITRFGKSDWFLVPSAILGFLLLAVDWTRVERRLAAAWTEVGGFLLFLFAAVAGSGLTTDLIKWIVGRSRPGRFDIDGVLSLTPFASDSIFFSFPSGHATTVTAAALAAILFMRRFRLLGVALLALAAAVAVSRIAVRAHFPSDVIGGIAIGAGFTYGLAHVLGRTGVAFQRLPEGGLMAKTVALRGAFRTRGGEGRMARALVALFRAGRRGGR